MMLEHMGWGEAAQRIIKAMEKTFKQKIVTYDLARMMDGAREVKTSEFATAVIDNMGLVQGSVYPVYPVSTVYPAETAQEPELEQGDWEDREDREDWGD